MDFQAEAESKTAKLKLNPYEKRKPSRRLSSSRNCLSQRVIVE